PGSASGPNRLACPHESPAVLGGVRSMIVQRRNASESRNSRVPAHPQAAAKSTAAAGEASATKIATSTGPRMKISSMRTDSSEYAVASASSFRRSLKKVRMHTVMGGNEAPAAAASAKASQSGTGTDNAATSAASADGNARAQQNSVERG